ncbi:hypothetical protein CDL12_24707 [Handroanthus impetiginosus]|uniref:Uncharacterized protein n=1 Tax=Handroanthus impetiginosus TaxID=429701 RepID=A0A2G9GC67_9LAMI|nr:hypothetical protein CDL12_24707 [Handroanthus impetiginosus]
MAANLQSRGLATFGKLFVSQIRSRDSVIIPSLSLIRRGVHVSVYDKNVEEHFHPTVVPDDVIPSGPEKYWIPHPQTGVFGPPTDQKPASSGDLGLHVSASADSVLEEKAFFRPLEDLDKPIQP